MDSLVRAAEDPDVCFLVVGTRGHGGILGLMLGSVSQCVDRGMAMTGGADRPAKGGPGVLRPVYADDDPCFGDDVVRHGSCSFLGGLSDPILAPVGFRRQGPKSHGDQSTP